MIAEILKSFASYHLQNKIGYHLKKINEGVARELNNSLGDPLSNMYKNMLLVSSLNDRVKLPFKEIVLSSPLGEKLSDDKYQEIAQKYLERMGYDNTCYSIILHEDKFHTHLHLLFTTIDLNGKWVSDSKNWARSDKIMREIEKEYGLQETEKGKSSQTRTLGESMHREYFFDNSLRKALRSYAAKAQISNLLEQSENYKYVNPDLSKPYTNTEWKVILGVHTYEELLDTLYKGKFLNPLFKDELLNVLDDLYSECKNSQELRKMMEENGYYMRFVEGKRKPHYIYGIPEQSFYIKDSSLPQRFRFGQMCFAHQEMAPDEQKHYLYHQVFATLKKSGNFQEFMDYLSEQGIKASLPENKEVGEVSFVLEDVNKPVEFKASELSVKLTYENIQDYFRKNDTVITPVVNHYANNSLEWQRDINYMNPGIYALNMAIGSGSGKSRRNEDEEDLKKKKKKRKLKGLSR